MPIFPKMSIESEESLIRIYDSQIDSTNRFQHDNEEFIKLMISLGLVKPVKGNQDIFEFTDIGLDYIKILKNKNRRSSILRTMTLEDYILAIDYLSMKGNHNNHSNEKMVSMSDLARYLGLSNSSISEYIRIIEKENLIIVIPRKGVKLTAEGSEKVKLLLEKRDFLYTFFKNILKIDNDQAEVESHVLEHNLSPAIFERLKLLVDQLNDSHFDLKVGK